MHRDDCPAFQEIRERYAKRQAPAERPALLLYRLIDGLVDSFFPILGEFDDRIDELENAIFTRANWRYALANSKRRARRTNTNGSCRSNNTNWSVSPA